MPILPRRVLVFRASHVLKDRINRLLAPAGAEAGVGAGAGASEDAPTDAEAEAGGPDGPAAS